MEGVSQEATCPMPQHTSSQGGDHRESRCSICPYHEGPWPSRGRPLASLTVQRNLGNTGPATYNVLALLDSFLLFLQWGSGPSGQRACP